MPYRALLALPLQVDSFIVAPCNKVAKYFYTGAHLQYNVVEFFLHLAYMVEVVRTNFAPIFTDFQFFSAIRAPIVAPLATILKTVQ